MNIKSLILGSAAAIVAAGAAQAADLPVAEPVDYVKVCDAYGAGYFFIPGTDTCLKINGEVMFGITSHPFGDRTRVNNDATGGDNNDMVNMYVETNITFTAREETEYGTLTAVIELDDEDNGNTSNGAEGNNTAFDKAWLSLGGFYAGVTDGLVDFNAGTVYDDYGFGGDTAGIGYAMAVGNGVTITVAAEDVAGNQSVGINSATQLADAANVDATVSMPAFGAGIGVEQGWGSIKVAGQVFQVRYPNAVFDTDLGWRIGGKASFNVVEGLSLAVAGGYSVGYGNLVATRTGSAYNGTMNEYWAVSAGLTYAFTDQVSFDLDAGYEAYNDKALNTYDVDAWGISGEINYVIVPNLTLSARVGYRDLDWQAASGNADWDDVRGRVTITRTF